jgi:hypothetical protein
MVETIDTTKKNRTSRVVDSPLLTDSDDEDDTDFYDALDVFQSNAFRPSPDTVRQSSRLEAMILADEETKTIMIQVEDEEPEERDMLPWLKDPNAKISIWSVIKDNIGKDISKISVPVFFNDPTSLLQKCAQSMEYNDLLDRAGLEPDPVKRIALIAIHGATQLTICERTASKPFNPLLGETFEYVTKDFSFLSEQVTHHPPVTANYCRSNKGLYTLVNNQKTNTKFNGKYMGLVQQFRTYIELDKFNERYEMEMPVMSAHNLVIGKLYVDIGDQMTVRKVTLRDGSMNQGRDETCILNFHRSGFFAKQEFKLDGEVTISDGSKRKKMLFVEGKWNGSIAWKTMENGKPVGEFENVWTKRPYPEQWESMYGMSHFSIQLNYFPKRLHNVVAPTDTRRRQD